MGNLLARGLRTRSRDQGQDAAAVLGARAPAASRRRRPSSAAAATSEAAASCQGATRGGPRSQGHLGAHAAASVVDRQPALFVAAAVAVAAVSHDRRQAPRRPLLPPTRPQIRLSVGLPIRISSRADGCDGRAMCCRASDCGRSEGGSTGHRRGALRGARLVPRIAHGGRRGDGGRRQCGRRQVLRRQLRARGPGQVSLPAERQALPRPCVRAQAHRQQARERDQRRQGEGVRSKVLALLPRGRRSP
mmetsp:Transcript_1331/g.2750  ORF Transcript_1331/g.2750 Transcript_1331/m.2750 type:complete len:247 (+) Transcript_1331:377-1117(+)